MMYFNQEWVDLGQLPAVGTRLKYADLAIVDSGGFSGNPGPDHTVPDAYDPRRVSSVAMGKQLFEQTIADMEKHVRETFGIGE